MIIMSRIKRDELSEVLQLFASHQILYLGLPVVRVLKAVHSVLVIAEGLVDLLFLVEHKGLCEGIRGSLRICIASTSFQKIFLNQMKQEYSFGEEKSISTHRHCNSDKPSVNSTPRSPLLQNTNQKLNKSNLMSVTEKLEVDVSQLNLSVQKGQNTEYRSREQLARDLLADDIETGTRALNFFEGLPSNQKQMVLVRVQSLRDAEKDQHRKVIFTLSLQSLKKIKSKRPKQYISQKSGSKGKMGKPQSLLSQSTTHDKDQKINNGSSQVQHGNPLQRNIGSTCSSFFSKLGRLFTIGSYRKTEDRQFAQPSQQQQLEPLSDNKKVL